MIITLGDTTLIDWWWLDSPWLFLPCLAYMGWVMVDRGNQIARVKRLEREIRRLSA